MKLLKNKRSFLITIMALLLLLPIFYLTSAYTDRNKQLQTTITFSGMGDKLSYVEDDIISNVYSDLLSLNLSSITRSTNINISFNQILLAPGRDYNSIMNDYETFIEGNYATLNNLNISLINFGDNFTVEPYNTTFKIIGDNFTLYTMPTSTNYIQGVNVIVSVGAENNSACAAPSDDGSGLPLITVTYNHALGSCTNSVNLDPIANNDAGGQQFYLDTTNPTGSIEVKYGQVGGTNGIFTLRTWNISANVTQLDVVYNLTNNRVKMIGGNITITSVIGDITKENEIILAEE